MKRKLIAFALFALLTTACNAVELATETPVEDPATAASEADLVAEDVVVEEDTAAVAEEPAADAAETVAETDMEAPTAAMVDADVELYLLDALDGILNNFCLDIAGGNQDVDPANGLQGHTCYSYQGDLGTDQVFNTGKLAENVLYMPIYDVCAQAVSLAAGSEVGLAACDGSELQSFTVNADGTIAATAAPDLCLTLGAESRFGRGSDHQIRDLSLETCSAENAAVQQFGARVSLDEIISIGALATE